MCLGRRVESELVRILYKGFEGYLKELRFFIVGL